MLSFELYFLNQHKESLNINKVDIDNSLKNTIEQKYNEYINTISSPEMAISFEMAMFIFKYCVQYKPSKIVDLGSGFSSFILRLYQKMYGNENTIIYSVDDSKEWLLKTKEFIQQQDLNTSNLFFIDEFINVTKNNTFDLVILDLNFVDVRKKYLQFSIDITSDNGLLIIDDVHKIEFLREVKNVLKRNNVHIIDLKNITFDSYGRFALGVRIR
ncbi:MAG: methyltransferase domain-containing protein [Bacteroidia bacterium]